jgi:hypothetical protein
LVENIGNDEPEDGEGKGDRTIDVPNLFEGNGNGGDGSDDEGEGGSDDPEPVID